MAKVAVKQPYWLWVGLVVWLVWLGWRVWPLWRMNGSHLTLLTAVMQGETIPQPDETMVLTGLQARALARLIPTKAETWLKAGVNDSSQMLTYLELCLWYWDQRRKDEAVTACREGQGVSVYWIRQAIETELAGNAVAALSLYEMATRVEPESAEAWYRLAVSLQGQQRPEDAAAAYTEAIQLGYPAYDSLGAIYLQLGQLEEARQVLLAGVAAYPSARYTYLYLAQVAEAEEKWTEADDWYWQLTEVAPDYGPGFAGRGRIAFHLGQYTQAVIYFQQATLVEPNRLSNWLDLGGAAAQSGDTATARDAYQQALVLQPDNQQAQTGLQALGQE